MDNSNRNANLKAEGVSRKQLQFIIGIAVVAVLGLAVVLALSLTVWAQPNKQDFKVANTAAKQAHASFHKITEPFSTYSKSLSAAYKRGLEPKAVKQAAAKDKQALSNALNRHMDDVERIDDLKALNDDKLRDSYEKYQAHQSRYVGYMKEYIAAFETYSRAANFSCPDIFNASKNVKNKDNAKQYLKGYAANHARLAEGCLKDLNQLKQSGNKPFATYARAYITFVNTRQDTIEKGAKGELNALFVSSNLKKAVEPFEKATDEFIKARNQEFREISDEKVAKAFYALSAKKEKEAKTE